MFLTVYFMIFGVLFGIGCGVALWRERNKRQDSESRLKGACEAIYDWSNSWINENNRRLSAQRESESWKTRCFEMSQSAALQANVDFARIKNLEAQIRALQIKRAHKKGGK